MGISFEGHDSWLINECQTRIQENFILIFKYTVCNGAHCNLQLCKFVLCNDLKFICCIDVPSMWHEMASGGIAVCTMQISWTGYQWPLAWTALIDKVWAWVGHGLNWWSLNMNKAQAWALSRKQLFLVSQCWDSWTMIQWCSILKSSPLHIEMQKSSSNFALWILFFFGFFIVYIVHSTLNSESSMFALQELKFDFRVVTCVCVFVILESMWFCQFGICAWFCHFLC